MNPNDGGTQWSTFSNPLLDTFHVFKMCQRMSTLLREVRKDALNSPRLSDAGPIVPILPAVLSLSAVRIPLGPWILQTDPGTLSVGSFWKYVVGGVSGSIRILNT